MSSRLKTKRARLAVGYTKMTTD